MLKQVEFTNKLNQLVYRTLYHLIFPYSNTRILLLLKKKKKLNFLKENEVLFHFFFFIRVSLIYSNDVILSDNLEP